MLMRNARVSGNFVMRRSFRDSRGECVSTLTIEDGSIVVLDSPDWSTGSLYHRFPKTLGGFVRAVEFINDYTTN